MAAAVLLVFRFPVVALFGQNAELVAAGGLVMLVSFPFYRIYAFIEVFAGVCRGIGKAKEATLITLLCFVAMRLMLLLLVQRKLSRGKIRPAEAAAHGEICPTGAAVHGGIRPTGAAPPGWGGAARFVRHA